MNIKKDVKIYIGLIVFESFCSKYLSYFFESMKAQTVKDFFLTCQDNSEKEIIENRNLAIKKWPSIDYRWTGANIGFGRAFNLMIKRAAHAGAKYFIAINPDMIFDSRMIEILVEAMENDISLGSASPKIYKWDFAQNKKTRIIDSCGIRIKKGFRFFDIGQGEEDSDEYASDKEILGPSGAAAIYRMDALEKIKEGESYFDELMFMYKEDCDLNYRMRLAGFKSKCIVKAIAYHDRTVSSLGEGSLTVAINRKNKSRQVKRWSFINQQIILTKYWHLQNASTKIAIVYYQILTFSFIVLFEQYLLWELINLWKIRKKIKIYK